MKKCPQCGLENQLNDQFCKRCGAKLTIDKNQPMTREAAKKKDSKRKYKVIYLVLAIILILIFVLFGIAQATGKHSFKPSSAKLSKIEKKNSSIVKRTSVTMLSISSSLGTNINSGSQTVIQTMSDVNTRNLTTQQVNKWVYANIMSDWNKNNTDEPPLTPEDQDAFIFDQSTDNQGCVEIQVQENHQSAFMKSINAYPESTPTIGWYRINAQGYLQQRTPGNDNWNTIAQNYQEP